jgi:hypothetical protein
MPKFHTKRFERDVAKALASKDMQRQAYEIADRAVRDAQKKMIEDFNSHPVTKEVEGGASASNSSGTLGGYGNLFTFIGFPVGSAPTLQIRKYLTRRSTVSKQPKIIKRQAVVDMAFRVDIPTVEGAENVTPSPWSGKSWTREVERGISGFGFYMYSDTALPDSRSGRGAQTNKKLRALAYRPVKYISSILEKFYNKIR